MARRPRLFAPGLLFHIIVRGNQGRKTFVSDADYQAYLERLGRYRRRYGYTIHAYCLMPNHVHLLIESSAQPLAKFMQGLQQSYSQYFNLHHRKTGHVFQGRYKAIVCEKDEYLLQLIRYIHLNAVRAGMVKEPQQYLYSGHRAYLDGTATEVIDPRKVLTLMGGRSRYRSFVGDGMKEGHREEYYEVEDQRFLGAEGFGEKLQEEHGEPRAKKRRPLEKVVQELADAVGTESNTLKSADRSWTVSKARTMIAYVLVRRQGYALSEVARYFGRDAATVGTLIGRLSERMAEDEQIRREIDKLNKKVEI
ncbi:MAG: transposase [Deltaproteobacteria bacterium]|nr:transposase [Deltaproteobacteria bacterium]